MFWRKQVRNTDDAYNSPSSKQLLKMQRMGRVEGKAGHNWKPSRQVAERHEFKLFMQDNPVMFYGFRLGTR